MVAQLNSYIMHEYYNINFNKCWHADACIIFTVVLMVAGSGIQLPLDRSSTSTRHLGEVQHYNTIFRQLSRVTYHALRPYCCACTSLSGQFSCMPCSPHMLSVFVDVYDCMSCCAVGRYLYWSWRICTNSCACAHVCPCVRVRNAHHTHSSAQS